MKKKTYFVIFIIFIFINPLVAISQISNETQSNHKLIKFDTTITIENAQEQFKKKFGLDDNNTFVEFQSNTDKNGGEHIKFQQYYNGVKVQYGTMIVHIKNGAVTSINGELYNPSGLTLTSDLTPTSAFEKAKNNVGAQKYLWDDAQASENIQYKKPEGELVIFPVISNGSYTLTLAYKFDIYATKPVSRGYIYIDAKNGDFLFNDPIIKHYNSLSKNVSKSNNTNTESKSYTAATSLVSGTADTRYSGTRTIETRAEIDGTFTLNDETRDVHTYNAQNSEDPQIYLNTTFDFIDNDNNWTSAEYDNAARDNAALDAHWGAMKVYDFWASLGRNSYDNAGAEIRSYVHVGTNYFNAFWNGYVMSYGDGSGNPLVSMDVCAHEIAHAITTWTADLVYARESGAMNEAFSDIFAAATEHFAKGTGTDLAPNPEVWLLAEDFWPGGYLRSMSDPKSKSDPDTYNGLYYTDATSSCIPSGSNDYCGVHSNSGVLNHWFYILVAGKSGTNSFGNSYNVTGIGMAKAQEIAYLMLRDYLTPNSTFINARNAGVEVATSLYGSNSAERQAVQDAFYAVNLGDQFVPIPTDIKLVAFSELVDITCGDPVIPKIMVRNEGATNVINTIQINYSIDGVPQTPFNWNGTLALDEETEITLPAINETAVKSYNLTVEAIVAGDGDATNNSIAKTFKVNKTDNNPTIVNDFEQILVDYWLTYNQSGGSNLWAIGAPNKTNLNEVSSGNFAQITGGSTGNYTNETKAYLVSPCFDLTVLNNPIMKFQMAFKLQENYDILYVQYSTDAVNWTLLGSATDLNWYNSDRIFESGEISSDCQNCPGAQWTGSSTVLTEYSHDLSALASESNVNFRFVFHSDASVTDEGVVIDDFVIEEGSLGVNDIKANEISIFPNPSKNTFNLACNRTVNNMSVEIFDVTGKTVFSKTNISSHDNNYELDMSYFSKGLYFAKIEIENAQVVKKLILQ